MTQIDIIAPEAPFGDHRGYAGGQFSGAFGRRIDDHTREPRRQWKRAQFAAFLGDAAVTVDSAKLGKQRLSL